MSLGQSKTSGKELKVLTWANQSEHRGQIPGHLGTMRIQYYGIGKDDYADALADAVFQLEVEVSCGSWIH